jgi:hypothetical protein
MTASQGGFGHSTRYEFNIALSEVRSAAILAFDAYWRSKSVNGRLPGRKDILPWEIVAILPDIVLLDVEPNPFRCRIRLVGTRAAERRGDHTGKYLDQVPRLAPERRDDYLAEMRHVCTSARPAFARDWLRLKFGGERDIYAGIWPLAGNGHDVDMLVVIEDWADLKPEDLG